MQQGNETKKEITSSHTSKQDLEILQQLSPAEHPTFFKHCLEKNHLPEYFLQLWNYLSIAEQQAVLGGFIQGERFLTWAIKQVHLPLARWFLSDVVVEMETQSDPVLWAEFRSIRRKTTDHTWQQYLVLLSKLNPGDPLLTRVLLQLSQYYLSQQDHQKAMHYAAGAFYHTWRFSPTISISLLAKAQAQIQQVLTQCLQSYHPHTSLIYFNFFDRFLDLQQHRAALKKYLPNYPAAKNTILWDWFSINTGFFKSLVADLWKTAIHLQGVPPCGYALLGLGSMARDEMCPYSDVECALLIEKNSPENRLYFQQVSALFYLLAMTLGEVSLELPQDSKKFDPMSPGFHIDDAFNPTKENLLGTTEQLLRIQEARLKSGTDAYFYQHMLRTVCFLTGEKKLVVDYQQCLNSFYSKKLNGFLGFFSEVNGKQRAFAALEAEVSSLLTLPLELFAAIDIKKELYYLPSQFLSHLTLYHGLEAHSARARLILLEKNKKLNEEAIHHLDSLISQALHLRAAAQLHYGCKREEAYTKEKYSSDVSRFFIHKDKALHRLYCWVLSLEEILKQFVQSKGGLDLYKQNFQNTSQVLLARAFAREGSFDGAEKIYRTLTHQDPNSTETRVQLINFYYVKYQTFEHEWCTYKQEGEILAQQLVKILQLEGILSDIYFSYYRHLPHDCKEAFKKAVSPKIGEILARQSAALGDILENEGSYWERCFEQADAYVNLQKKDQALKQAYLPKAGETGLERTGRSQCLNEKRLVAYKMTLFDSSHQTKFSQKKLTIQELSALEALVMCLFSLLEDKLKDSKANYQKAFENIKNCLKDMIADWQKKGFLEKDYVAVYALLTPFCRKLYREQLLDYKDRAKQQSTQVTKTSQPFTIEGLLKTLNQYPDEDGQRADWVLHKRQWEATLKAAVVDTPESVKKGNDPKRLSLVSPLFSIKHQNPLEPNKRMADNPPTSTTDGRLCYLLTEHTRSSLLTANGEFQAHRILGSQSDVIPVTVEVTYDADDSKSHKKKICEQRTIYFKKNPKMAGMGYLVERLHHQSIGHGTSLSELVRLEVPGKPPIPVLISEEIQGENFDTVLQENPQQLSQLSSVHFSELALLAMLTNPGDAKPANYIWVKLENGLYSLVSVDHDYALFPAYLLKPADSNKPKQDIKPVLQVLSILFCLDAMHQPIDSQARAHFCQLDPTQVLRQVLQQAQVQNTYYGALFLPEELQTFHVQHVRDSKQGCSGDPKQGCTIPIPLQKGDMVAVYQKFVRLQKFLEKNPQATLLQCLIQAEPRVGLAYKAVLGEPIINPRDRLIKVGAYPIEAGHMITSGSALASRCLGGILTKANYAQLITFSPEQGLAELDLMAYQHRQLKSVQEEVQRGEFGRFMELLSQEDQEAIICGDIPDDQHLPEKNSLSPINWQKLKKHQQEILLKRLIKIPMQRLYLANCDALTPEILIDLMRISPDLLELRLNGQKSEQMDRLPQLLNKHPTLRILYLKRASELSELQLQLPALETLVIDDSLKLSHVWLDTPQLKVLRAAKCHKLERLYVSSPVLTNMDCSNDSSLPWFGVQLTIPTACSIQTPQFMGCEKMGVLENIFTKRPFLLGLTQKNLTEQQYISLEQALEKILGTERLVTLTTQQKAYLIASIPQERDDYRWIEDIFKIYEFAEKLANLLKKGPLESKQAVEALILEKVYDPDWQEIIWFTFDLCRDNPAVLRLCVGKLLTSCADQFELLQQPYYLGKLLTFSSTDRYVLLQQPIQQLVWLYHLFKQASFTDLTLSLASFSHTLKEALRQMYQMNRFENILPTWFQKIWLTYQQNQLVIQSLGDDDWFAPTSSLISEKEKENFLKCVQETYIVTPTILSFIRRLSLDSNNNLRQYAIKVLEQLSVAPVLSDFLDELSPHLSVSVDKKECSSAVETVGLLGMSAARPDILNKFVPLLKEGDFSMRCNTVDAIGRLGAVAATANILNTLARLLVDKDQNVRRHVIAVVGQLGAFAAKPDMLLNALVPLLAGKDKHIRISAVKVIGQMGAAAATSDTLDALSRWLEDEDKDIRISAVETIGQLGTLAATFHFLKALARLLRDKKEYVRTSAVMVVKRLGESAAKPDFLNALSGLLANQDKDIRRSAVEAIGQLGTSAATPGFLKDLARLLMDKKEYVGTSAVMVVACLGASVAKSGILDALAGLLKNKNKDICRSAIKAVERLGESAATSDILLALENLLADENSDVRDHAVKAVGQLGASAATPGILSALIGLLADKDVRPSTVEALGRLGPFEAKSHILPNMLRRSLVDKDKDMRSAIEVVERLGESAADILDKFESDILDALAGLLKNEDKEIRHSAVKAVGSLGAFAAKPNILKELARLLDIKNKDICRSTVEAVRRFGVSAASPDILDALARLLKQAGGEDICSSVLKVVGQLGASAARPDILDILPYLLKQKESAVPDAALRAIGQLGASAVKPDILEELAHLLVDENKDMCRSAIEAVRQLGASAADSSILKALSCLLVDEDKNIRISAVEAIGQLRMSAAKSYILEALADKDKDIRRSAAKTVGRLGASAAKSDILDALARLLADENWDVRDTAAKAVEQLGASAATPDFLNALSRLLADKYKKDAHAHIAGVMEKLFIPVLDVWINQKINSSTALLLLAPLLKEAYLTGNIRCQVYFDRASQEKGSYVVSYSTNQKQDRFPILLVQAQLLRRLARLIPQQLAQNKELDILALEVNRKIWPKPEKDPVLSDSQSVVPAQPIPPSGTALLLRAATNNEFEVVGWLLADDGTVLSAINAGKVPLSLARTKAVCAFLSEGNSEVSSSASGVNPIPLQPSPAPVSSTSESKIAPGTSVLLANSWRSGVLNAAPPSHPPIREHEPSTKTKAEGDRAFHAR